MGINMIEGIPHMGPPPFCKNILVQGAIMAIPISEKKKFYIRKIGIEIFVQSAQI